MLTIKTKGETVQRMRVVHGSIAVTPSSALLLTSRGGDGIDSAASCSELEVVWVAALGDPEATGDDLDDANGRALDRAVELQDEADQRDNQLQYEACPDLVVQLAIVGGTMNPTFETCDDGSLAVIGECP